VEAIEDWEVNMSGLTKGPHEFQLHDPATFRNSLRTRGQQISGYNEGLRPSQLAVVEEQIGACWREHDALSPLKLTHYRIARDFTSNAGFFACFDGQSQSFLADPMWQFHKLALGVSVAPMYPGQDNTQSMVRVFAFANPPNGFSNLGDCLSLGPHSSDPSMREGTALCTFAFSLAPLVQRSASHDLYSILFRKINTRLKDARNKDGDARGSVRWEISRAEDITCRVGAMSLIYRGHREISYPRETNRKEV
jgi:hypothetical protein